MKGFISIVLIIAVLLAVFAFKEPKMNSSFDEIFKRAEVAFYKMEEGVLSHLKWDYRGNIEVLRLLSDIINGMVTILNILLSAVSKFIEFSEILRFIFFTPTEQKIFNGLSRYYIYSYETMSWTVRDNTDGYFYSVQYPKYRFKRVGNSVIIYGEVEY